jgi:hypothetical protein
MAKTNSDGFVQRAEGSRFSYKETSYPNYKCDHEWTEFRIDGDAFLLVGRDMENGFRVSAVYCENCGLIQLYPLTTELHSTPEYKDEPIDSPDSKEWFPGK